MKTACLLLSLLLAGCGLQPRSDAKGGKQPCFIECRPEGVVLYPGSTKVDLAALQTATNLVEKMCSQVADEADKKYVVLLVRPRSAKAYSAVRRSISRNQIQVMVEPVDADRNLIHLDSPKAKSLAETLTAELRFETPTTWQKQFIYFECRSNELFFVDLQDVRNQIYARQGEFKPHPKGETNEDIRVLKKIGTPNYKLNPGLVFSGYLALDPRDGVIGENCNLIAEAKSKFQIELTKANPVTNSVVLLVRDDSFGLFRCARSLAEKKGLQVLWEPLEDGEPIKSLWY